MLEIAVGHGIKVIARLPIDPMIATACDKGIIEDYDGGLLDSIVDVLEKMEEGK